MPDEKNIDVDVVDEEKKEDFEDICFLCRRPESKAGKMITLPGNICRTISISVRIVCRRFLIPWEKAV